MVLPGPCDRKRSRRLRDRCVVGLRDRLNFGVREHCAGG